MGTSYQSGHVMASMLSGSLYKVEGSTDLTLRNVQQADECSDVDNVGADSQVLDLPHGKISRRS